MAETDEGMRERLNAALVASDDVLTGPTAYVIADAVLPTVRALIADELRAAADGTVAATWPYPLVGADGPTVSAYLRARADALDPR